MPEDVFRWVVAVAVVLSSIAFVWQAFILAAIYRAGMEAREAGKESLSKVGPMLERLEHVLNTSSKILDENRPRVAEISKETLAIAKTARQQADRIGELADDANQRARARIAQIDRTVGQAVAQVEQVGDTVRAAVLTPMKEVNGILAGIRAGLAVYRRGGTRHSPEKATQDEAMFI
jgi:hypothetical protein